MKIFETFKGSGQNLSNSLCQFLNDKSISVQILHPSSVSWKITPLYFFSSKNIYFAQKKHIKMKSFENVKCSGQNPLNSSCKFWNDKSILLQILHHSSLTWHITPWWILSLHFFYFGLIDPIKIPILRLSISLVNICIFLSFSKPQVSFSSNSALPFRVMTDNSSVFFRSNIKYFAHFSL